MNTWSRAAALTLCGRCTRYIEKGEPLFLIPVDGVKKPKQRCVNCAGEPVPADLPLDAKPPQFAAVAQGLNFGEREPGEDG